MLLVSPSAPRPRLCHPTRCPYGWLEGSARTVETAPAADVAGCLIGQDVAGGREAGELDLVSQLGAVRQLDEGDVIAGEEGRVMGSLVLQPVQAPPLSFARDILPPGCARCPFSLQIPCILTAEQLEEALLASSAHADPWPW